MIKKAVRCDTKLSQIVSFVNGLKGRVLLTGSIAAVMVALFANWSIKNLLWQL
jgi:hypothetical protein